MRIRYNQTSFKSGVIIGAIWVALGLAGLFRSTDKWSPWVYFLTGIFYFGIFLTQRVRPYVITTTDSLQVGSVLPRRILLTEITRIKYFAGEYTITTGSKKAVINLDYVSAKDVDALKERLAEIELKVSSKQAARVSG